MPELDEQTKKRIDEGARALGNYVAQSFLVSLIATVVYAMVISEGEPGSNNHVSTIIIYNLIMGIFWILFQIADKSAIDAYIRQWDIFKEQIEEDDESKVDYVALMLAKKGEERKRWPLFFHGFCWIAAMGYTGWVFLQA